MMRLFDAPREAVFEAYTDPEIIPQWWGLRATTTVVDKMDVTPGGEWRYILSHPEHDAEYVFHGEYRQIVPPDRLVSSFIFESMPARVVLESAVFRERDGKTQLTVTSLFDSKEARDGMLQPGPEEDAKESWDRLAEYLASATS